MAYRGLISLTIAVIFPVVANGDDWPAFRGVKGSSVAAGAAPLSWSTTENVAWKAELPGRGPASPIVVANRVFTTASGGVKQNRLYVLAHDVSTGDELWRRQFWATGRTLCHPTSANAAPTPASNGEYVVAFYSSNDLICLDLDGNLQWYRGLAWDYPKAGNDVGMSSSPLIVDDTVVVQIESQGDSFAAGISIKTGETLWRIPRDKDAAWCSPAVLQQTDGSEIVLLQNAAGLTGHDPDSGDELWRVDIECDKIASPAVATNAVFIAAEGITALTVANKQDEPVRLWGSGQLSTGSSSPVVHDGKVYTVNRSSVLACSDANTGKTAWKVRLGIKQQWATPVLAGSHIYCIDNEGETAIVEIGGNEGKLVGTCKIEEPIQASLAVADGAIFIRSDRHLWKIK